MKKGGEAVGFEGLWLCLGLSIFVLFSCNPGGDHESENEL